MTVATLALLGPAGCGPNVESDTLEEGSDPPDATPLTLEEQVWALGAADLTGAADAAGALYFATPSQIYSWARWAFNEMTYLRENTACPVVTPQSTDEETGTPEGTLTQDWTITGGGCVDDFGRSWEGSARLRAWVLDDGSERVQADYAVLELRDTRTACTGGDLLVLEGDGALVFTTEPDGGADWGWEGWVEFTNQGSDCTDPVYEVVSVYAGEESSDRKAGAGVFGVDWVGTASSETEALRAAGCDEPGSGTAVLTVPDHEAVVTFDGETDCSDPPVAPWSLDGTYVGDIELWGTYF